MTQFRVPLIAALVCGLQLAACSNSAPPASQPPEVGVIVVQVRELPNRVEVPGRVQAVRAAEVRARVDGIVQRRVYNEGSDVVAGKELFLIDPSELHRQSERGAGCAGARRGDACERSAGRRALSKAWSRKRRSASRNTTPRWHDCARPRPMWHQTRAQLEAARLSLGYTRVTAPISGRAGRAQVTEGALVSAAAGTLLTTVEQLDPVYVNLLAVEFRPGVGAA